VSYIPPVIGERMRDLMLSMTGTTTPERIESMATKRTRIKSTAAVDVPQSREEVAAAIAEIGERQRERDRIAAAMNDALANIRQGYEAEAAPHAERIKALFDSVKLYCESNRGVLTGNGKTKTARFASGEVSWRTRPKSVALRGVKQVIQALKDLGLAQFLRTKEEVNKEAILADPEAVSMVTGISVKQGEDFVIKPWDTGLDQERAA
jgi:phage host-nuclease inhibitor protein Gam